MKPQGMSKEIILFLHSFISTRDCGTGHDAIEKKKLFKSSFSLRSCLKIELD